MSTISPTTTIVSAILIVVVLVIALSLRGKIKRNERGNEFFPWEREAAQGDRLLETEEANEEEDAEESEEEVIGEEGLEGEYDEDEEE